MAMFCGEVAQRNIFILRCACGGRPAVQAIPAVGARRARGADNDERNRVDVSAESTRPRRLPMENLVNPDSAIGRTCVAFSPLSFVCSGVGLTSEATVSY